MYLYMYICIRARRTRVNVECQREWGEVTTSFHDSSWIVDIFLRRQAYLEPRSILSSISSCLFPFRYLFPFFDVSLLLRSILFVASRTPTL